MLLFKFTVSKRRFIVSYDNVLERQGKLVNEMLLLMAIILLLLIYHNFTVVRLADARNFLR